MRGKFWFFVGYTLGAAIEVAVLWAGIYWLQHLVVYLGLVDTQMSIVHALCLAVFASLMHTVLNKLRGE